MNVWYDSDIPRVLQNMTVRDQGHEATYKHPLFPLLAWPVTTLVMGVIGDAFQAVRIVLALNAALFTGLLLALLARMGVARVERCLVALLGLSSAGFLFWFGVPETFPFGATSVLIGFWGALLPRSSGGRFPRALILVGILAFAVTITNIAVFAIALGIGLLVYSAPLDVPALVRRWVWCMGLVVVCTAVLAVVQDQIFGNAGLFFNVVALAGERQFIGQEAATPALARPGILLLGTFVASDWVMVPTVNRLATGTFEVTRLRVPVYAFQSGIMGAVQGAAVLTFVGVWATALSGMIRQTSGHTSTPDQMLARQAVGFAAAAVLASFLLLHLIYGAEVFLYVAHFLPAILLMLGAATARLTGVTLRLCLSACVVLSAVYNGWAVLRAYGDAASL